MEEQEEADDDDDGEERGWGDHQDCSWFRPWMDERRKERFLGLLRMEVEEVVAED